mgnify:CR=1 FL=1
MVFNTTKATLTSGNNISFFSGLLRDDISTTRLQNGAYFIDRDGAAFAPILNFLRTGTLLIPPTLTREQVFAEAEFYCIPVSPPIAPIIVSKIEPDPFFLSFIKSGPIDIKAM